MGRIPPVSRPCGAASGGLCAEGCRGAAGIAVFQRTSALTMALAGTEFSRNATRLNVFANAKIRFQKYR